MKKQCKTKDNNAT